MSQLDARPVLFVISGPSGAGKGTALAHIADHGSIRRIATYTTRDPRPAERDGIDYNFVDESMFFKLHEKGVIFEYTRTYAESYYGSPRDLLTGDDQSALVVELDPAGFVRVRAASARRVVGIFITTKSEDELRTRIKVRGQGQEADQRLRIRTRQENWGWTYDYVVINDEYDKFTADIQTVINSELIRTTGARHMIDLRQQLDPTLTQNQA